MLGSEVGLKRLKWPWIFQKIEMLLGAKSVFGKKLNRTLEGTEKRFEFAEVRFIGIGVEFLLSC